MMDMKKMLACMLMVAMLFSMTGCVTRMIGEDLMVKISAKPVKVQPDLDAGATAAANFGVALFKTSLENGTNTLISPLSVLYALAMTANGAEGETLAQMEQVLGMESDELNGYMLAYLDSLSEKELHLANSIWFKDDPAFVIEDSFLQTNADFYGADAYKVAFDEATRNTINNWVKENTDGMIPEIIDEIPDGAIMYLVNALAFDAQWEKEYEKTQVWSGTFTTEDGIEQDVDMMHSEEHTYLEDEQARGFIKYYKGGRYAFVALLPKEGVSVADYVDSLTGEHLMELLSNPISTNVVAAMPKFEVEYDVEMGEILKEMGMTDAFDGSVADFSRLGTSENGNIRISRVLHKTFISVAEQGTKAGAATAVEMVTEGALLVDKFQEVTLDRPFVYLLMDCETNLPFFIGTMMTMEGN